MTSVQRDSDTIHTLYSVAFFLIYSTAPNSVPCLKQTFSFQVKGMLSSFFMPSWEALMEVAGSLYHYTARPLMLR
jgi:hypothetical protein